MAKIKDTSPQKQPGGPIVIGPTEEEREGLKRHCPCGARTAGGQECEECRKKRAGTLQPKASSATASRSPASAPPIVGKVLNQPGRALPSSARSRLESAFGRDFSRVRVHSDDQAAQSARAVAARAYTVGQHIVFDHGQYDTDSPAGMHLLAHELAHTVQQDGSAALQRSGDLTVAPATDALEHQAEEAADRALRGETASIQGQSREIQLQRAQWGPCPAGENLSGLTTAFKKDKEPAVVAERPAKGTGIASASKAAELRVVGVYKEQRSSNVVAYDALGDKDENISSDSFYRVTSKEFFTNYRGQWPAPKQPDILDYSLGEVYDVTTVDQTPDKVGKIVVSYVGILNTILERQILGTSVERTSTIFRKWKEPRRWKAGQSLAPPKRLTYPLNPTADPNLVICFGSTNLADFPGVIAYEVIRRETAAAGPGNFSVRAAGSTLVFDVAAAPKSSTLDQQPAATAIRGLKFKQLERKGKDVLIADFEGGPLNPVTIKDVRFIVTEDRRLTLDPATKVKPFEVEYLSKGSLTKLSLEEDGLHGEGTLKPSLSLLKNADVKAHLAGDNFSLTLDGDPKSITPSIPNLKITQAELGLVVTPELSAEGKLGVAFGPPQKPVVDGLLKVTADARGLVAAGDVHAHIPGVDKAEGNLTYSNGHLSGSFTITTDQLRLPGVTSASLTGGFNDQGVSLTGSVDLKLPPGDQPATLKVEKRDDHFVYTGEATFAVPGINPVKATVVYDGTHFTGTGSTGFDIQGLHGTIKATYRDGEISGKGKAQIEKGRVKGEIGVTLNEDHTLTGEGTVSVQITDNLVGTVGVKLDKNKKVHVDGEIAFPKPIHLFDRFPRNPQDQNKELFNVEQNIPIPGLSIGIINVVAHVGARLGVSYYVGPGELRDVKLAAGFDPLEETKNLAVHGHALLVIPAHAGVFLVLEGGLGLSAAGVAEATGGLTVRGDLGLDGLLSDQFDIDYRDGRFLADSRAEIHAGLNFSLALGAYVEAKIGVGPFKAGTRKDWVLKAYAWNGPSFGVVFPIHYASNEPFQPPSFDQIQFERPKIDANGLLGGIFGAARSTETQKEPGA
jgi:hypothetical protein